MFTTLNSGSLTQIHAKNAGDWDRDGVSTLTGKPKRLRLKNGCGTCRSRKKKCDEQHPSCGYCGPRHLPCVYRHDRAAARKIQRQTAAAAALAAPRCGGATGAGDPSPPPQPTPHIAGTELTAMPTPFVFHLLASLETSPMAEFLIASPASSTRLVEVDDEGVALDRDLVPQREGWNFPAFLIEPSTGFLMLLNERSMRYVSYFHREVVNFVSITPLSSPNHFANTYMAMAASEESILALLATWGALFIDGPTSESYMTHLAHARRVADRKFKQERLSDMDKFAMICYYAGLAGLGICAGDTSEWYEQFRMCKLIMSEFGSVRQFLARYHHLNQVKWLVSNLQYHDVMSSISMRNGTLNEMSEYAAVFEDEDDLSYGVDPLQGCIHPVFLLLGEIINAKVKMQRELKEIEDELAITTDDGDQQNDLTRKRLSHYARASQTASELIARVEVCEPKRNQQCFLDPNELEEHLTLFEAFRNTCKLHICMHLQGLQANAPEVQLLLVDTFKLIDLLIPSLVRPAIGMVLLTCGLCCCYPADRARIQRQFHKLRSVYKVFNVNKIQQIVEQSWTINPNGNINISWVEMCEKLGWILAAS